MTPDDLLALKAQLTSHEARRADVYDDASGLRIRQGSLVHGHPTWGIGFNLDTTPFCEAAIDAQYDFTLASLQAEIARALPWVSSLPAEPQRAILDIAWNAGVEGLLKFHVMLGLAQRGQFGPASLEIIHSQLAQNRAQRLAMLMGS